MYYAKRRSILTAHDLISYALYYLKATNQSGEKARFDVVTITSDYDNPRIEIIKNAFELAYP